MVDRDPVPEGFEKRCIYCGRELVEEVAETHIVTPRGGYRYPKHFCSEECANAYESLTEEIREESEEIYRAGAT